VLRRLSAGRLWPQLLAADDRQGFGVSNTANGFINIIPWVLVAVALYAVPSAWPTRRKSKTPYIVIPALSVRSACFSRPGDPEPRAAVRVPVHCRCRDFCRSAGVLEPAVAFLKGAGAAAGLAAINSVGNLGGFVAQNVVPGSRMHTGSTIAPMFFLAACLAAAGILVIVVQRMFLTRQAAEAH
jgi:nitrate/nitrite transporter NarK